MYPKKHFTKWVVKPQPYQLPYKVICIKTIVGHIIPLVRYIGN